MLNYFSDDELACKCGRPQCDAKPMDMPTMMALNGLRLEFGFPMKVNSARRCKFWNAHPTVKGRVRSQHLDGTAVDIHCPDGIYMRRLIALALKHGFSVGVKKRMLHLDTRGGPPVVFGY